MADRWFPAAQVVRAPVGGRMEGPGHVRAVVWHTSESSPDADPAAIARYVIGQSSEYHLIWRPTDGKIVQLIAADEAARSLRNDGWYRTNRVGSVRIQICVVGRAQDAPLTRSPLAGWDRLRAWLRSWNVPEVDARDDSRSRARWAQSGHSTHRSAPGNDHTDPGSINFDLLFGQVPTPTGDDDMIIIRQGTKSPILIHGSATTVLEKASAESMEKAGVPSCKVTADDYQRFKAQ